MKTSELKYDGDTHYITVLTPTSGTYISVDTICKALGRTERAQIRKIKEYRFKVTTQVPFSIHVDDVQTWLGTFYPHTDEETQKLKRLQTGLYKAATTHKWDDAKPDVVLAESTVQSVPFDTASIYVVKKDNAEWILLQRVCEVLGIDAEVQRKFLGRQSWAGATWTAIVEAQVPGSLQKRRYVALHRKRFAMWLATLNQDLVDDSVLPLLQKYQCEAADVLDTYFNLKEYPSVRQLKYDDPVIDRLETRIAHQLQQNHKELVDVLQSFFRGALQATQKKESTSGFYAATRVADLLGLVTEKRSRKAAADLVGATARKIRIHPDTPNITPEEHSKLYLYGHYFNPKHEGVTEIGEDTTTIEHWRYNLEAIQRIQERLHTDGVFTKPNGSAQWQQPRTPSA